MRDWHTERFLQPGQWVPWVGLSVVGTVLALAGVVWFLHEREKVRAFCLPADSASPFRILDMPCRPGPSSAVRSFWSPFLPVLTSASTLPSNGPVCSTHPFHPGPLSPSPSRLPSTAALWQFPSPLLWHRNHSASQPISRGFGSPFPVVCRKPEPTRHVSCAHLTRLVISALRDST